jgi:hypothetical protein
MFSVAKTNVKTNQLKPIFLEYSRLLFHAFQKGEISPLVCINNNHPDYLGMDTELLKTKKLLEADFLFAILKDHGFDHIDQVADKELNLTFENAVELLLDGKVEELKTQLKDHPQLIHQSSIFGHAATLLHYTGSNGVEMWRQRVPMNLKAVVQMLLEFGSDKNAFMKVYGGLHSTKALMATSAHPWDAGIDRSILDLL